MNKKLILSWILRALAALVMLQTLFFKFSASEESVYIFSTLGMEPWGRIASGIAELIASVLLLIPSTITIGALMGGGIMAGALAAHLTKLGIVVMNDGGYLFILCLLVLISSICLLILHRSQLKHFISILLKRDTALSS